MRGFVGTRGLKFDKTKDGRPRMRFDLCAGDTDKAKNKYPVWRHIVLYGELAQRFSKVRPGKLISVEGWLIPHVKMDSARRPIFVDGQPLLEYSIIARSADFLERDSVQGHFKDIMDEITKEPEPV